MWGLAASHRPSAARAAQPEGPPGSANARDSTSGGHGAQSVVDYFPEVSEEEIVRDWAAVILRLGWTQVSSMRDRMTAQERTRVDEAYARLEVAVRNGQ